MITEEITSKIDFLLVEAACLAERRKELDLKVKKHHPKNGYPLVRSVEEAFELKKMQEEVERIDAELEALARELATTGFPQQIWIAIGFDDKEARLRLYGCENLMLKVEF